MKTQALRRPSNSSANRHQNEKSAPTARKTGKLQRCKVFLRDMGITLIVMPFAALALVGIIIVAAVGEFLLSLGAWATQRPTKNSQDTSDIQTEGPSHGSS